MTLFDELYVSRARADIEDTYLPDAANYPKIIRRWQDYCNAFAAESTLESKAAEKQLQYSSARASRYWDHFFDRWTHPADGVAYTVELARFPVPVGGVAIVRQLNQWVSGGYTLSGNWGTPFTGAAPDNYLWSLRLVPLDTRGVLGAQYVNANNWLPGIPYQDLPQWQYLWYLPHSPGASVNLIIPGGYCLKFFVRTDASEVANEVMGRIAGYWHPTEYSDEASINVRKGY